MVYGNFRNFRWQVKAPSSDPSCPPGTYVTFEGRQGNVTVCCGNATPYALGVYNPTSHTISGTESDGSTYTISMAADRSSITLNKLNTLGSSTGTWTADDNGPWPGGE